MQINKNGSQPSSFEGLFGTKNDFSWLAFFSKQEFSILLNWVWGQRKIGQESKSQYERPWKILDKSWPREFRFHV